ncbi:MAG: UspA domain protein [Polyangiaceae bacterium]|jgi:nucleotide-binding universal stress UspA family protein|nr:UspA domain protein [Polyangiaceae bacterium]
MKDFTHLLVPTDFGSASGEAVELAIALASSLGAKLTLLHTWEIPAYPYMDYVASTGDLTTEIENAAAKALADALAVVKTQIPDAAAVLRVGAPWQQVIDSVGELGVDLVVMGTHGRRGLSHHLLGSVAEKVVRLCPVPVLTVRGKSAA